MRPGGSLCPPKRSPAISFLACCMHFFFGGREALEGCQTLWFPTEVLYVKVAKMRPPQAHLRWGVGAPALGGGVRALHPPAHLVYAGGCAGGGSAGLPPSAVLTPQRTLPPPSAHQAPVKEGVISREPVGSQGGASLKKSAPFGVLSTAK